MEIETPGSIIKSLRKQKKITQKDFSKQVGTYQANLSKIENDEISPSVDFFIKMIECLGYEMKIFKKF